ncbi:hypothetical protein GCM10010307_30960 [Streptomyces vastus]|uniref:Uncharacterized protein n=1 Tax=Streptomyces vastus TaxID=285451 RepID=A0ABP6D6A9_9ACTN
MLGVVPILDDAVALVGGEQFQFTDGSARPGQGVGQQGRVVVSDALGGRCLEQVLTVGHAYFVRSDFICSDFTRGDFAGDDLERDVQRACRGGVPEGRVEQETAAAGGLRTQLGDERGQFDPVVPGLRTGLGHPAHQFGELRAAVQGDPDRQAAVPDGDVPCAAVTVEHRDIRGQQRRLVGRGAQRAAHRSLFPAGPQGIREVDGEGCLLWERVEPSTPERLNFVVVDA